MALQAEINISRLSPQRRHGALLPGSMREGVEAEFSYGVLVGHLVDVFVRNSIQATRQDFWRLDKAAYGHQASARLFAIYWHEVMTKIGFQQIEVGFPSAIKRPMPRLKGVERRPSGSRVRPPSGKIWTQSHQ